jgi:hypothetical protein
VGDPQAARRPPANDHAANVADETLGAPEPRALVAVKTQVYVLAIVSPITLSGERL